LASSVSRWAVSAYTSPASVPSPCCAAWRDRRVCIPIHVAVVYTSAPDALVPKRTDSGYSALVDEATIPRTRSDAWPATRSTEPGGRVDRLRLVHAALRESDRCRDTDTSLASYHTPDWLSQQMVDAVFTDPREQRLLDPACGFGDVLVLGRAPSADRVRCPAIASSRSTRSARRS
jgi:hypothetical protein